MREVQGGQRRVVVTGLGAVTPLGLTVPETWKSMLAGCSGVRTISLFDARGFPTRIAGEVRGFDFSAYEREYPHAIRSTFFAVQAADEAFRDAGIDPDRIDPRRFGIYLGAGDSGIDFEPLARSLWESPGSGGEVVDKTKYLQASSEKMNGFRELESQPFMTATHLARRFRILGPATTCLTACAASSQAIGEASEWIRRGDADIVMSGGSHSMIYPLGIAGFSLLTALSARNDAPEKASRPFDKRRDGFVLSEGAGIVILEDLLHAVNRRARIYGEIAGFGSTADAYRLTDMDAGGAGAGRAIEMALRKASLPLECVDHINAHGTSTRVNDSIETLAIKRVFKDKAFKIPVTANKSMLGHMIAAAGAVELMSCLMSIRDSVIPPTVNYEEPDPECDLDYVPNRVREVRVKTAVSNSFGFGGQNICLAVRAYEK